MEVRGDIFLREVCPVIKYIPVLILLGYTSYTDLKKRIVPDGAVILLLIYSLFLIEDIKQSLLFGLFIFAVQLILAVISDGGIGGGDIKLMSVMAFMMGYDIALMALPLAILMIFAMAYSIITKKGLNYSVPFVPYIFISYCITLFFKFNYPPLL